MNRPSPTPASIPAPVVAPRLTFDPTLALKHLRKDPALKALIRRCGPFGLEPSACPSPFQALAESITSQQLNARAAASIFQRFLALFPAPLSPASVLGASDETLRSAGLSRAKAASIRDLAQKVETGEVPDWDHLRGMEDEAIIEHLTKIRGIGRWTVEMLLIFRLGRPDVWPVDDFAIRKAYGQLLGETEPTPKAMRAHAEGWRPYRSVVAWYLWRSLDN